MGAELVSVALSSIHAIQGYQQLVGFCGEWNSDGGGSRERHAGLPGVIGSFARSTLVLTILVGRPRIRLFGHPVFPRTENVFLVSQIVHCCAGQSFPRDGLEQGSSPK